MKQEQIFRKSKEKVGDVSFNNKIINICSVGKITRVKGYDRLARVHKKLIDEGLNHHIYILGIGEDEDKINRYIKENNLQENIHIIRI